MSKDQSKCPGHDRPECVSCCWPKPEQASSFRGDDAKLVLSIQALLSLDAKGALAPHGIGGLARQLLEASAERLMAKGPAGYTAVDMTTAAAQGFRDGQVSVCANCNYSASNG